MSVIIPNLLCVIVNLLFHLVFLGHLPIKSHSNSDCHNIFRLWFCSCRASLLGERPLVAHEIGTHCLSSPNCFFPSMFSISIYININPPPPKKKPANAAFYFAFLPSFSSQPFLPPLLNCYRTLSDGLKFYSFSAAFHRWGEFSTGAVWSHCFHWTFHS